MCRSLFLIAIFLSLIPQKNKAQDVDVTLQIVEKVAKQGIVKLRWTTNSENPDATFELYQSETDDFSNANLIYKGKERTTFISGLNDGTYLYKIRMDQSYWSNQESIEIIHHNLTLALFLLCLGFIVFACTMVVVIQGHRKTKSDQF